MWPLTLRGGRVTLDEQQDGGRERDAPAVTSSTTPRQRSSPKSWIIGTAEKRSARNPNAPAIIAVNNGGAIRRTGHEGRLLRIVTERRCSS